LFWGSAEEEHGLHESFDRSVRKEGKIARQSVTDSLSA
jgi:hypothetical protein